MLTDSIVQSRRKFLGSLTVIPFLPYIASSYVSSMLNESTIGPRPANPLALMTAAKSALDVMQSFSSGKDSGMAAMMRYQRALLLEISTQLNNIQDSLLSVQTAIDELPTIVRDLLAKQYKHELITQIRAAASRYDTYVLQPSRLNADILKNEATKIELNNIIMVADQNVFELKFLRDGIGPEACMIAPLAMSLNIAGRTNLGFSKEVIVSALMKYDEWFGDMLSNKEGSIVDTQNKAARNHDRIISEIENDHLAQRLGLHNFKLKGSQIGTTDTDPGVLFYPFGPDKIKGGYFDERGGTKNATVLSFIKSHYSRISTIQKVYNKDLDVYFIKLERSEPTIASHIEPHSVAQFPTHLNKYYYIYVTPPFNKYKVADLRNIINNGNTIANKDDISRARIEKAISEANVERATMSFCAQAIVVAQQSKSRIAEYLNVIR